MNTRMKWFNSITFIVFVVFAVLGAAEEKRNDIEAASLDYVDEPEPIRPSRPGLMITIRRHWVEFAGVALVTAIVLFLGRFRGESFNIFEFNRIPLYGAKNKTNKLKFRRYSTPIHLLISITIKYAIENWYFLIVVVLQVYCNCSPTGKHSTYPGLIVALIGKLAHMAAEEYFLWRQEAQANSVPYKQILLAKTAIQASSLALSLEKDLFEDIKSGEIRAGTIILVEEDGVVPVDGIIIASSELSTFPILFNESTLTGETAPAAKTPLDLGVGIQKSADWKEVAREYVKKIIAMNEPMILPNLPNAASTRFDGKVNFMMGREGHEVSFTHKNAAYRGSKLKGTKWVLLLTVYTGHSTKEGLSFIKNTGVKNTPLDLQLSQMVMWVNVPVILLGSLTATLHSAYSQNSYDQWAILRELAINFLFLNGLNNLSTRFIGDLVRIAQCLRMGADSHLLIETNRTIPDTLGNVQVIISDKTGTITKNQLKLEQIAVADDGGAINLYNVRGEEIQLLVQPYKGSAQDEPRERVAVNRFLSFMAVANAVVPKNESYFSSNPDDLEFVHEARKLNHELVKRSAREDGHMIVVERLLRTGEKAEVREDVEMKVLYEHDFDSSRKYMSVIQEYQARDGKTFKVMIMKGADTVLLEKLTPECRKVWDSSAKSKFRSFTQEGKRLLVWAYKIIDSDDPEWTKFVALAGSGRDIAETTWSSFERNMRLAGFTVVSDKLQDGVQDVITYARNCGIKVVMATGDAFETAEAIWRKLGQVHVHPTDASVDKLERFVALDFTDPITKEVTRERVIAALARFEKIKLTEKCVLIVDGTMLTHLKSTSSIKDLRGRFCAAMDNFDSVVAARVTADQKGEINDIYQYNGNVTLAIGDGGNDITMIQKATVSVGLRSAETDSAARAADFKIQEFRHLQGLLIYGLHNYFRLSTVYLWNDYKAILLALVPFIARWSRGFTGDSLIPGDMIFILTTVVLAPPVIIFGIFDVPISVRKLMREAHHYNEHRNSRFDWMKKALWWMSAGMHVLMILVTMFFWWPSESSSVQGVIAAQLIGSIANMRLILETRRLFSADAVHIILAALASSVLVLPISNLNPMYDVQQRFARGNSLFLPSLSASHWASVLIVALICLGLDMLLYAFFGEEHSVRSWWRKFSRAKKNNRKAD